MPFLLVDDRDGRIVAELESEGEAQRVLGTMASEDADWPDYLCLMEVRSAHGSLVGADTTIKFHTLSQHL
jgi:hypothetical protein